MTLPPFEEWADQIVESTRNNFIKYGRVLPVFIVYGSEQRQLLPLIELMDDRIPRVLVYDFLKVLARSDPTNQYCALVFEGWAAAYDTGQQAPRPPAQHEDRKEVVLCYLEARDGRKQSVVYEIKRPWDDAPPTLERWSNKGMVLHQIMHGAFFDD